MECWNNGIVGGKSGKSYSFIPLDPSFQYSIVPIFQFGQSPEVPSF
jgi:hypothetical protein